MKNAGTKKGIVLVSSGQPSANPRLVKEATALSNAGFAITVVYCPLSPWADKFDQQLFIKYSSITWISAGFSTGRQPLLFKYARLRRKLNEWIFKQTRKDIYAGKGLVLFAQELFATARKYKADLYIGHNLGALPVVVKLAKLYGAKAGFDAEDFHRGEHEANNVLKEMTVCLENQYMPHLNYLSVASPLIGAAYKNIFPSLDPVIINNVFSKKFLQPVKNIAVNRELKLLWFSQTIGKNRGIETVIEAMGILNAEKFSLTLLGTCSAGMKAYLYDLVLLNGLPEIALDLLSPVKPDDIFNVAGGFDIGIASEPGRDENNHVALSNKLFTYLLAGNAVLASNTRAQVDFFNQYDNIGLLYEIGNAESLARSLKRYLQEDELLQQHKFNARKLADIDLNWEKESKKLIRICNILIS